MKKKYIIFGVLILLILGIVFGAIYIKHGKGIMGPEDITQITFFEEGATYDPDWSPDGSQIVFERHTEGKPGELYVINSDGTGLIKIGGVDLYDPSWSPVDNRVVCNEGGGNHGLYVIDLDKNKTETIPLGVEHAWLPAWSPDGTKIAYTVYDESNAPFPLWDPNCDGTGIKSSIWIMNSDGTGKTRLTTDEDGYCGHSSFSPDGSKIVYVKGFIHPSDPSLIKVPANEIWVMNRDGSDKHAIYKPKESVQFLYQNAWNKNDEIIFARVWHQKVPQIWLINSDGTDPRCLIGPTDIGFMLGLSHDIYVDMAWDSSGTKIILNKLTVYGEKGAVSSVESNIAGIIWKK
jgi:Tol biopolymer transport system component